MNTENKPTVKRSDRLWYKVLVNLLIMCGVGIVILWIAILWLDSWTHHGEYLVVPDVKGKSFQDARNTLVNEGFTVELTDSIYDISTRPGTVVEQNPKVGTKVKDGRLIYVTINAFSPKSVTIPNLTDISLRQAQSTRNGVPLSAGARIAVDSHIVLEVGDGNVMPDSASLSTEPVEQVDLL